MAVTAPGKDRTYQMLFQFWHKWQLMREREQRDWKFLLFIIFLINVVVFVGKISN